MSNGNTSPYGELFDLPTGTGDINWDAPSSQEIARIQQDPNLQMQYLMNMLESGEVLGEDVVDRFTTGMPDVDVQYASGEGTMYDWISENVGKFISSGTEAVSGKVGWGPDYEVPGAGIESFMNLTESDIYRIFGQGLTHAGFKWHEGREDILGVISDLQEGFRRMHGGDANISSLQRELGLTERGVTGPGGLTQQKGSMADMLQQKIGQKRQAYVPQEKKSRYGQVTGTSGGVDPTQSYLSGVEGDVSAYGTSIAGVDKNIYDILYGTGEGSIFDVYGDYGNLVEGSLFDGDDLWYE